MNYIDDFGGIESSHDDALEAFQELEILFDHLGLESSSEKDCPPSTRIVFLSLNHDVDVARTVQVEVQWKLVRDNGCSRLDELL